MKMTMMFDVMLRNVKQEYGDNIRYHVPSKFNPTNLMFCQALYRK
jgi:hypothetical protein